MPHERLLDEPWFALPPPKSTGREVFHLDWVQARLRGGESAADVQTSLLELTAVTVADALRAQQPQTQRVLVCGGGVHNARFSVCRFEGPDVGLHVKSMRGRGGAVRGGRVERIAREAVAMPGEITMRPRESDPEPAAKPE